MIALPENAIEPAIASARPGQRARAAGVFPSAEAAGAPAAPGSAAMVCGRISWDSRDDVVVIAPAARQPRLARRPRSHGGAGRLARAAAGAPAVRAVAP